MYYDGKSIFTITIIIVCILAYFFEYSKKHNYGYGKSVIYIFLSLILIFVFVSTDSGVDYYNYYETSYHYTEFSDVSQAVTTEPLYVLSDVIMIKLTGNGHVAVMALKLLGIVTFLYGVFKIRKYTNTFIAILSYCSFYYIQSIYLIRIQISSAFIFLSIVNLYLKTPRIKILIPLLIALGFHFSAFLIIMPFTIFFLSRGKILKNGQVKIRWSILLLSLFVLILASYYFIPLLDGLMSISDAFAKFHKYDGQTSQSNSGLFHIFRYLPVFIFLIISHKSKSDREFILLITIWSIFGFTMTTIPMGIFIRLIYIMSPVFIFYIPYFSYANRSKFYIKYHLSPIALNIFLILYFIVNIYIGSFGLFNKNDDSELFRYHFVNPIELIIK